jgi:hypothetical protein
MKSMPQFQEMKSKFSLHMDIANKCMNIFNELNLEQIGMLEQDLCMLEAKGLSDRIKMQSLRSTLHEYLKSRTTFVDLFLFRSFFIIFVFAFVFLFSSSSPREKRSLTFHTLQP